MTEHDVNTFLEINKYHVKECSSQFGTRISKMGFFYLEFSEKCNLIQRP